MDIITTPGPGSTNKEERITFQLKYNTDRDSQTFDAEFLTYSRITQYSAYKTCSDLKSNKLLNLCICDIEKAAKSNEANKTTTKDNKQTELLNLSQSRNAYTYTIKQDDLYVYESISHIVEDHLGLLKREVYGEYKDGKKDDRCSVTFELINYSPSRTYEVNITLNKLDDMKPIEQGACRVIAKPQSMRYVCTVARSKLSGNGNVNDYKVHYKEL